MGFIDPKYRSNLNKYKYHGVDKSLLSKYVLTPYWNWLVTFFPLWMAPNLITALGFVCILINLGLLLIYDPDLKGECPSWVYVSFGIGLWIYASFDAIDGKQARRTNQSGPLGQLFDHSCDALNTMFVGLLTVSAFRIPLGWWAIAHVYIAFFNFYLTTWEEYHTGTLYLSYLSGPVEGITAICILFVLMGFTGNAFCSNSIRTILKLNPTTLPFIPDIAINKFFIILAWLIMGLNIFNGVYNVVKAHKQKKESSLPALFGLAPFLSASVLGYLWLSQSSHLLQTTIIPLTLFFGFAVAYNVGLIILAHVTKSPFPYFNIMYVPIIFGAITSNLGLLTKWSNPFTEQDEIYYVYLSMTFCFIYYIYYFVSVVNEICDHFDIYCLSIKHLDQVPGYLKKDDVEPLLSNNGRASNYYGSSLVN